MDDYHNLTNQGYSIITPVFNRADCISRCIESVARNLKWCENAEHIIVDDGSTDDTSVIIEKYAAQYSHIKFIKFERNSGTNAARNAAIMAAKGTFCIILDSDDYFADDALQTIDTAINEEKNYGHYLFAPDDMCPKYENNLLLKGKKRRVLSFVDFLNNSVTGDFVHVIKTDTLRKYPFDESLRIYEGVFFLRFYKEANKVLFTNKVVTIRERNRKDSVSRDFFRTRKVVIERNVKSINIWMTWFTEDCERYGLYDLLKTNHKDLLENYLLLCKYDKARCQIRQIESLKGQIPFYLHLTYKLRLGLLFRYILKLYLVLKYKIFKAKLEI